MKRIRDVTDLSGSETHTSKSLGMSYTSSYLIYYHMHTQFSFYKIRGHKTPIFIWTNAQVGSEFDVSVVVVEVLDDGGLEQLQPLGRVVRTVTEEEAY